MCGQLIFGKFNEPIFFEFKEFDLPLDVFDGFDFFVDDFLEIFDFEFELFLMFGFSLDDGLFLPDFCVELDEFEVLFFERLFLGFYIFEELL